MAVSPKNGSIVGAYGLDRIRLTVIPPVVWRWRSRRERWLSLPWRPWMKTELVANPACPADGEFLVLSFDGRAETVGVPHLGGHYLCNPRTADALKRAFPDRVI